MGEQAFSKVPLLVLEVLASVGSRLLKACSQVKSELLYGVDKPNSEDIEVVATFPTEIMLLLKNAEIHLLPAKADLNIILLFKQRFWELFKYKVLLNHLVMPIMGIP